MRIHNLHYKEDIDLAEWISQSNIHGDHVFVQIYTSLFQEHFMKQLINEIVQSIPKAVIIGCTSNGQIMDGHILPHGTVLSFIVFEETHVRSASIDYDQFRDSFIQGESIAKQLLEPDTKAFIFFIDSQFTKPIEFLKGVQSIAPLVIVAGGLSLDESGLSSVLFTEQNFIQKGVVGVSLSGSKLMAGNKYSLSWQQIGKFFTITSVEGGRVYTIDHLAPLHLYKKYLGDKMTNQFFEKGDQFPLILTRSDMEFCRAPEVVHEDGSITFSGNFHVGEKVRFGFGDPELIVDATKQLIENIVEMPAEAILVFNCAARRRFMFNSIDQEIKPLQSIASTIGFFTNGEFYHHQEVNEIFNHSMTLLILSENASSIKKSAADLQRVGLFAANTFGNRDTLRAISHLAEVSTQELNQLNASLEASEQRYKSLVQYNPDIVFSLDTEGGLISLNQTFYNMLGYSGNEIHSFFDLIDSADINTSKRYIKQAFQGKPQTFEVTFSHKNKSKIPFLITNIPIIVHNEIVGVYGIAKNISERIKAEEQVNYLAYHDVLTQLPNRLQFNHELKDQLTHTRHQSQIFAVLFLDLDHFKMFNDTLGHYFGDQLLKQFATELKLIVQDQGIVARFGGDEFTIIMLNVHSKEDVEQFADKIVQHFKHPLLLEGKEYYITTSIGISLYPTDGEKSDELLRTADLAMYQAKQSGKNRYAFYKNEMNEHVLERHRLEIDLRKVLDRNQLQVFYQPIIDLGTSQLLGSEALARWLHPELGFISPAVFIPIAEECGLIDEIGYWVLQTACKQTMDWQRFYGVQYMIAVNVSSHQFQHPDFVLQVKQVLQETGLNPSSLHLEITESTALNDVEYTKFILETLRKIGISISMDDFGTGYSSLSYIKDFSIDKLKIDRSFITNISVNVRDAAIVKTIIALARNLNFQVVAEGVETIEQLEMLHEYDCDQIQGFYISKPIPSDEFEKLFIQSDMKELPFDH
ncbi:MAG: diguanylate cyclase [Bacilli bacterium]|nr:diguanylate cyclase [Bacilli bacterium]